MKISKKATRNSNGFYFVLVDGNKKYFPKTVDTPEKAEEARLALIREKQCGPDPVTGEYPWDNEHFANVVVAYIDYASVSKWKSEQTRENCIHCLSKAGKEFAAVPMSHL